MIVPISRRKAVQVGSLESLSVEEAKRSNPKPPPHTYEIKAARSGVFATGSRGSGGTWMLFIWRKFESFLEPKKSRKPGRISRRLDGLTRHAGYHGVLQQYGLVSLFPARLHRKYCSIVLRPTPVHPRKQRTRTTVFPSPVQTSIFHLTHTPKIPR